MQRRDKIIRYHVHARRRMNKRGIDDRQVEEAIYHPDAVRPAKRDGARRYEKKLSKRRRVRVIAEETDSEIWVITAW